MQQWEGIATLGQKLTDPKSRKSDQPLFYSDPGAAGQSDRDVPRIRWDRGLGPAKEPFCVVGTGIDTAA